MNPPILCILFHLASVRPAMATKQADGLVYISNLRGTPFHELRLATTRLMLPPPELMIFMTNRQYSMFMFLSSLVGGISMPVLGNKQIV